MGRSRLGVLVVMALSMAGCTSTTGNYVNVCLKQETNVHPVKKILVLPIQAMVCELGAKGDIEEVPRWSKSARMFIHKHVMDWISKNTQFKMVDLPELSEDDRKLLDQHLVLYGLLATSIDQAKRFSAWEADLKSPSWTIGDKLAFLSDKTGADVILIVTGQDYVSSEGRKATAVLYAVAFGVAIPMGYSSVNVGIIDLKSGNLLWTNTSKSEAFSLRDDTGAKFLVNAAFSDSSEFMNSVK